ncbi:MAG: hypothetical protein RIC57_14135 [Balneola sp.]|jgi:hypothetical protein|tara:strand:- start:226078 stop:226575 length:498 start_codon:yes stop_codon:yes gene_type:complete
MKIIPKFILISVFLFLSCTSNDAQREFESEAYTDPSGITRTSAQGEVISIDPDDWRISPFFQGLMEVTPPFQNPAQLGTALNFEYQVTGVQGVSGLDVRVRYPNGSLHNIYSSSNNPLEPGIKTFQIDPIALSQDGSDNLARGLHRIFFFDFNQRLISYGDIEVE